MKLHAFAAERRQISPGRRAHSSKPTAAVGLNGSQMMGRTDRKTDAQQKFTLYVYMAIHLFYIKWASIIHHDRVRTLVIHIRLRLTSSLAVTWSLTGSYRQRYLTVSGQDNAISRVCPFPFNLLDQLTSDLNFLQVDGSWPKIAGK